MKKIDPGTATLIAGCMGVIATICAAIIMSPLIIQWLAGLSASGAQPTRVAGATIAAPATELVRPTSVVPPVAPSAVLPTTIAPATTKPTQPPPIATTTVPRPTATSPAGLIVYDSFDDNCIDASLWSELATWDKTLATSSGSKCWNLKDQGLEERDGRLNITCSNPRSNDNYAYLLKPQLVRQFSDLELSLTIIETKPAWSGIGLIFNQGNQTGSYSIWYGDTTPIDKGMLIFEANRASKQEKIRPEPTKLYSLPTSTRLRVNWDGTRLHLFVDGREVYSEPTQGYGEVFSLVCGMGFNSQNNLYLLKGYIDEVRIKYR